MKKYDFDKLLKPLIQIYDEIELDIIKNILNKLVKYDNVQGSLNWYLEKLTELKALEKENLKVILKDKNAIQKELEKIIENVGFKVDNLDKLKSYYDKGLIEVNPTDLYNSSSIKSLMLEALTDCTTIMDLINTKAIEGSNKAYRNIINKAYVETASGIYTYSESIRNALKEFAVQGIKTVNYENGLSLSIESAIRRDVVTRVNKLVGDKEIQEAKELGTNLMYVDQHLGARVRTKYMKNDYEAHAEWQGKKYMIEGSSKEYPNLYEKTGYGEMLGLKGINCYHHMQPTWEWEKIPNRIDEIENKEKYELLQKQRSYERKMRALKRERLIAKETDDKENVTKINKKIKSTSEDFNKWLEDNNLTRDYNREYIEPMPIISKKVKDDELVIKSNYEKITKKWIDGKNNKENIVIKHKNGDTFKYKGKEYTIDGKNIVIDYKKGEENFAEWLSKRTNKKIEMYPRFNKPDGFKSADYKIGREYFDYKHTTGSSSQLIMHNLRGKEKQSNNFIIEITNKDIFNNQEEITRQVAETFRRYKWVKKLGIKTPNSFNMYSRM